MKLWLLKPIDPNVAWADNLWDVSVGFVIRAETEDRARALAAEHCGDEGSGVWIDPLETKCGELLIDGPEHVILQDFKAG
jgi:hypothetical protein